MPAARASFWADTTTLRARGVNRVKSCAGSFAHEPLLDGLLGDPHAAADVGPRRPGPARPVDEVADEVVGGLAEGVGDDHGAGDPVQRVGVGVLDADDEVVEPGSSGHPDGFRHASTLS